MPNPAATLFLLALLAPPIPPDAAPAVLAVRIAGTDVEARLPILGWRADEARATLLRKSGGEYLVGTGWIGSDDVRATIYGGPAPVPDAAGCREGALRGRLLGMGFFAVGPHAGAEAIRELNPPYKEIDRHAFLVGAGAMLHVQAIALEGEPPEQYPLAKFEAIAREARFAVARRVEWGDLPKGYLDLSHAAALERDGVAWLRERAPGAGWLERLVLAEHATAAHVAETWVIEAYASVRTAILALPERDRGTDAGLLLAEDGLALARARAGLAGEAEPHARRAAELAAAFGPRAQAGTSATLAAVSAARGDVDGVVQHLEAAYALDAALRYRMQREPALAPVRADARVAKLLEVKLEQRSGRSLGG